jgi:hypothetical protein
MKLTRTIALFATLALAFCSLAMAQQYTSPGSDISMIGGRIFYAQEYNLKSAGVFIVGGNNATGSQSITLSTGSVKLRDGRAVVPFAVGVPITINDANQETVTIAAVSNCFPTGQIQDPFNPQATLCTITASFTKLHGAMASVWSGDSGFLEALNDAGNNGGGVVFWSIDCGQIAVSITGTTTTVASGPCLYVPKAFTNGGGSVYVESTITSAVSYSLGITSSTAAFITSCTALTAGTNCYLFQTAPGSVAVGTGMSALLITANTEATTPAGVIHATVWGYTAAQANY